MSRTPASDAELPSDMINIDLLAIVRFLRRQFWPIVLTASLFGAVAFVHLKLTPKLYEASAQLLIDTRKLDLFRAQAVIEDPAINTAAVESQIQLLRSEEIARRVVEDPKLKLLETEEFGGPQPSTLRQGLILVRNLWSGEAVASDAEKVAPAPEDESSFKQMLRARLPSWLDPFAPGPRSEAEIAQRAIQKFQSQLTVNRIGLSYVIQIRFVSEDPALSAAVANKIASTYIQEQLRSKLEMAEHAGKWLEGRIAELRRQATTSDNAVQTFKAANNFINAGDQLITDQQVQELSKQRILAEANFAEARARYERIKAVNAAQGTNGAVTDALDNTVIVGLQERYLDLSRRKSDLAARYGPTHRTVSALDREIDETRADMRSELQRLEETYKSEYEIAATRLSKLQDGLDKLLNTSAKSLHAQVQLRELQSTSNSYSSLYNSFLERYIQTVQQQSFPVTEAKVITQATKPLKSSGPGSMVILAAALALGSVVGCGLGVGRELMETVIKTPNQLEKATGVDFLGILPLLRRKSRSKATEGEVLNNQTAFMHIPHRMRYAIDEPFSLYAETIRSIRVAAASSHGGSPKQVIGVVSSMPGEGKTTVAMNLALMVAYSAGSRTLLLDLDLRNPSQTRRISPNRDGLLQVLQGKGTLDEFICVNEATGTHFLPAGVHRPISNTSEFLNSDAMQRLLADARKSYDCLILDLPPLVPLVDVRAFAHMVDGFVLIAEFGKTSSEVIRRALRGAPHVRQKLIGAVLNKVDLKTLARLESVGSTYYTTDYYMETRN